MKLAINCWVLRNKQLDGIGNFTIQTLRPLIQAHPEIQFIILCDKNFTENYFDFPNVSKQYVFPPLRHPLLYFFYMEFVLPGILKKISPDLFLSMDGFLSLRSRTRQLPVIYDLNFEHYPKDVALKNRIYFRTFFPKFARKAARIATISEYSKQDIVDLYKIDPSLIDNVSCGVKSNFHPLNESEKSATKANYASGFNYFFFVGSMHPRKNIVRLIMAFDQFKLKSQSDFKLLLAGHILWDDESIKDVLNNISCKNDIVFTGRVSDDELKFLLGASYCLTFVPTFEGFGLPIVEAFQAGVPVICSNTTSMPEVAGDACLLVDPFNINEITNAMLTVMGNESVCRALVEKGHKQKTVFTWENTAKLFYECISKAMQVKV